MKKQIAIGTKLSPILVEIKDTLEDFDNVNALLKIGSYKFTNEGFLAAVKIFNSALMDKAWEFQNENFLTLDEKCQLTLKMAQELKELIEKFTGINLYKQ